MMTCNNFNKVIALRAGYSLARLFLIVALQQLRMISAWFALAVVAADCRPIGKLQK